MDISVKTSTSVSYPEVFQENSIPEEVWLNIFSFLPRKDFANICAVSKHFCWISNDPFFWKSLYVQLGFFKKGCLPQLRELYKSSLKIYVETLRFFQTKSIYHLDRLKGLPTLTKSKIIIKMLDKAIQTNNYFFAYFLLDLVEESFLPYYVPNVLLEMENIFVNRGKQLICTLASNRNEIMYEEFRHFENLCFTWQCFLNVYTNGTYRESKPHLFFSLIPLMIEQTYIGAIQKENLTLIKAIEKLGSSYLTQKRKNEIVYNYFKQIFFIEDFFKIQFVYNLYQSELKFFLLKYFNWGVKTGKYYLLERIVALNNGKAPLLNEEDEEYYHHELSLNYLGQAIQSGKLNVVQLIIHLIGDLELCYLDKAIQKAKKEKNKKILHYLKKQQKNKTKNSKCAIC